MGPCLKRRRAGLEVIERAAIEEMKEAAEAGLWLNFTNTTSCHRCWVSIRQTCIRPFARSVPEHCTLSSDAASRCPNSVESLRLLRGHMTAFGCTADEIYTMRTVNPSFIAGFNLPVPQRARGH